MEVTDEQQIDDNNSTHVVETDINYYALNNGKDNIAVDIEIDDNNEKCFNINDLTCNYYEKDTNKSPFS